MAIRGEQEEYSLFVRHDHFLSPQRLLSNFLKLPHALHQMMTRSKKGVASPQLPVIFLEGISQAGPGLPEL
jgi:hypothetical protein